MNDIKQTPWYADKPFLAIFLGPILGIIAKKLGVPLNTEEIIALAATVVSFVVGHKWKGAVMGKAEAARLEAVSKVRSMDIAEDALKAAIASPASGIKVDYQ